MELIAVASNEEVAVNVTVSKYDYDKLKEGQKAAITIADRTYKGTVSRISKMATTNEKGAPRSGQRLRSTIRMTISSWVWRQRFQLRQAAQKVL